jgi:peptidoglycan/LPS O-acetylase OafA/YrhL
MAAALAVLYSHSFALLGLPEPRVGSLDETWGSLGVAIFFVVSGFLVCQSWERDPNLLRFAIRRGLRIVPGLVVAVFFTTFVAGALATNLSLADYLTSRQTWAYFVSNACLIAGIDNLPGAFEDMPHKGPNGSLWTLRYEVLMYAVLALLGLTRHLRACCVAAFAACAIGWIAMDIQQVKDYTVPLPVLWKIGLQFDADRIARLGALFFGASCMFLCRRHVPMSAVIAAVLVAAVMSAPSEWAAPTLVVAVPYITLFVAHKAPSALCDLRGWDLSYGIYIYAFPVQQLVSMLCLTYDLGWACALPLATVITLLLAAASWARIESPVLRLKGVFAPVPAMPRPALAE